MNLILKTISYIGLVLTLFPAFFVLNGSLDDASYKMWMLIGTVCWFATAPFWIFKDKKPKV